MPKLSVSVPDELWEAAKRRGGAAKTSELVQTALRLYVAGSRRAGGRSQEGDERFGQVLEGLVEEYKSERQRGYAAGLRAAEIIGFAGLNKFAGSEANFDGLFNFSSDTNYGWPSEDDYDDADSFQADIDELNEVETEITVSTTFRAGALQAFNDLWMELQSKIEDEEGDELLRAARELGIDLSTGAFLHGGGPEDELLDDEVEDA